MRATAMELEERLAVMREVLAEPPAVHAGAPAGVWRVEGDSCYEFLAGHVDAGWRTLETGLGVSTALLWAWGAEHTCIVPSGVEVMLLRDYMSSRVLGGSSAPPTFKVGPSDEVLPGLWAGEPERRIDLLFIDGCHGFPFPALDWYYGARWLRQGGLLVFDDLQIPAVAQTIGWFLALDPRWEELERNARWAAYRRLGPLGPLAEEWTEQLFLGDPRP